MITLLRGWIVPLAALAATSACCLTAFVLGGATAARWCIALCTLVAISAALTRLPAADEFVVPPFPSGRASPGSPYPDYDQIARRLSWSGDSRRSYDAMLVPWLRQLEADLQPGQPSPPDLPTAAEWLDRLERLVS